MSSNEENKRTYSQIPHKVPFFSISGQTLTYLTHLKRKLPPQCCW